MDPSPGADAEPPTDDGELDEQPHAPRWTPGDTSEAPGHPRWLLPTLVVPIIGLIIANNVGSIMFTNNLAESGLVEHPLRILSLNSTNKILLATGFQVDWLPFFVVPLLRLLAPDPLFYLLGFLYRDQALRFGRRVYPGTDRIFDMFEHEESTGLHRMLDILVFLMPNNPICLMAGVAGMPVRRFVAINIAGTLARIGLMRWLSLTFRDQVLTITEFIARYQPWAIGLTVVAVILTVMAQSRRVVEGAEELAD